MDPMEQINKLTNTTPSTVRFWVCPTCRFVEEIDMAKAMPAPECPGCKAKVQRVARPTAESAQEAIKNLENAARLKAMGSGTEASLTQPTLTEPKLTAERTPESPAAPAPEKVEPQPERGKRRSRAKESSTPAPEIPAPLAQAAATEPEPVAPVATADNRSDAQIARQVAVDAFIAKHKLSEHAFTRVSAGRVHTFGFTVWLEDDEGNRKPSYLFRDIADSGEYAVSLKAARASDGSIATDVVVVTGLAADIRPLVWNGELVASLRDGTQTHGPKIGSTVHLGAKVSRTGRLVWAVMGVA